MAETKIEDKEKMRRSLAVNANIAREGGDEQADEAMRKLTEIITSYFDELGGEEIARILRGGKNGNGKF